MSQSNSHVLDKENGCSCNSNLLVCNFVVCCSSLNFLTLNFERLRMFERSTEPRGAAAVVLVPVTGANSSKLCGKHFLKLLIIFIVVVQTTICVDCKHSRSLSLSYCIFNTSSPLTQKWMKESGWLLNIETRSVSIWKLNQSNFINLSLWNCCMIVNLCTCSCLFLV